MVAKMGRRRIVCERRSGGALLNGDRGRNEPMGLRGAAANGGGERMACGVGGASGADCGVVVLRAGAPDSESFRRAQEGAARPTASSATVLHTCVGSTCRSPGAWWVIRNRCLPKKCRILKDLLLRFETVSLCGVALQRAHTSSQLGVVGGRTGSMSACMSSSLSSISVSVQVAASGAAAAG
jgi:hypothetical protein